jgi:hypothetical protein
MIAEGVQDFHLGLSKDVQARLHNNLSDQAAKKKTCSLFISGLQHDIQNLLAQAECQSHNYAIKKLSPLLDHNTPSNSRPEIVLNNLCEQVVRGRKSIDSDDCSSVFALGDGMK